MGQTTDWTLQTLTTAEWATRQAELEAEGWSVVNISEPDNRVVLKHPPP